MDHKCDTICDIIGRDLATNGNLTVKKGKAKKGKYAIRAQFNIYTDNKEVVTLFRQFFQSLGSINSRTPSIVRWTPPRQTNVLTAC